MVTLNQIFDSQNTRVNVDNLCTVCYNSEQQLISPCKNNHKICVECFVKIILVTGQIQIRCHMCRDQLIKSIPKKPSIQKDYQLYKRDLLRHTKLIKDLHQIALDQIIENLQKVEFFYDQQGSIKIRQYGRLKKVTADIINKEENGTYEAVKWRQYTEEEKELMYFLEDYNFQKENDDSQLFGHTY